MSEDRRCGTCRYWLGEKSAEARQCHWARPALPFWADLEPSDHQDWTYADDGRRCRVWDQTMRGQKDACEVPEDIAGGRCRLTANGVCKKGLDCPVMRGRFG